MPSSFLAAYGVPRQDGGRQSRERHQQRRRARDRADHQGECATRGRESSSERDGPIGHGKGGRGRRRKKEAVVPCVLWAWSSQLVAVRSRGKPRASPRRPSRLPGAVKMDRSAAASAEIIRAVTVDRSSSPSLFLPFSLFPSAVLLPAAAASFVFVSRHVRPRSRRRAPSRASSSPRSSRVRRRVIARDRSRERASNGRGARGEYV